MKTVLKTSLFAITIVLAGCNEKVSPELQQGNATTPTTTPTAAPTEYYFSVTNAASNRLLNFKLHKTGAGNVEKACEIKNTTGLNNDTYRADPTSNDITCFFDAEELDLNHGGFSVDMNASKNTCDYVAYTPFGFYSRIPGDSSATYYQVSCTNATQTEVDSALSTLGLDLRDSTNTNIGCNEYVISSSDIAQGTRQRFSLATDADLCAFDHSQEGGANCDIGVITINEVKVTYTPATATAAQIITQEVVPRTVDCGGAVTACLEGPAKQLSTDAPTVTEIKASSVDTVVKVNYSYGSIINDYQSNMVYANFRKDLASKNMDFGDSTGLTAGYTSLWSDPSYGKTFDPLVLEFFSKNRMLDGVTPLISTAQKNTHSVRNRKTKHVPIAGDPYMGLVHDGNNYRVNPFYTFYCLDTAMDIKARIRMMVREWDRVFPSTSSDIEYLSDIFKGSVARQDAPNYVEVPDDGDRFNNFNDKADWDDLIPMERTAGGFLPTSTQWYPAKSDPANYPTGFFNPLYFPGDDL